MDRFFQTISVIGLCYFLSSCNTWNNPNATSKGPLCRHLTSKLIFNGATGVTRNAEIQDAEEPLDQRSYDQHCT